MKKKGNTPQKEEGLIHDHQSFTLQILVLFLSNV